MRRPQLVTAALFVMVASFVVGMLVLGLSSSTSALSHAVERRSAQFHDMAEPEMAEFDAMGGAEPAPQVKMARSHRGAGAVNGAMPAMAQMLKSESRQEMASDDGSMVRSPDQDEFVPPNSDGKAIAVERKLVKRAQIQMEGEAAKTDGKAVVSAVKELCRNTQGLVWNEDSSSNDYWISHSISIKVPAESFEETLGQVIDLADQFQLKVVHSTSNVEDITSNFVDTQARAKAAIASRDQLLKLMNRADAVKDVLAVQQQLDRVQRDVESLQARLRQMDQSSSLSHINLSLNLQKEMPEPPTPTPPSLLTGTLKDIFRVWRWLWAAFFTGFLYLVLVVTPICVVIYAGYMCIAAALPKPSKPSSST